MAKPVKRTVTIRLKTETRSHLEEIAIDNYRTLANLIEKVLEDFLDDQNRKPPTGA